MPGPSLSMLVPILAQAAQGAGEAGKLSPLMVMLVNFGPLVLLAFFIFFWMPMRNQRRRGQMIDALKKNDRVLTESGIFGTVVSIDEKANRIVLRLDDEKGAKATFRRSSVVGVVDAGTAGKAPSG